MCPGWRGQGRGHALSGCVSGLGLSQKRPWACGFRSLQGHTYSQASSCLPGSLGKHSPKGSTASSCLGWGEVNVNATGRERGTTGSVCRAPGGEAAPSSPPGWGAPVCGADNEAL